MELEDVAKSAEGEAARYGLQDSQRSQERHCFEFFGGSLTHMYTSSESRIGVDKVFGRGRVVGFLYRVEIGGERGRGREGDVRENFLSIRENGNLTQVDDIRSVGEIEEDES
ncbi:hypothetical protein Tco_1211484 [Tanacetum coccineum]